MSLVPFGSGGEFLSNIWTRKSSAAKFDGNAQEIVGFIPFPVIVTCIGNGTGVAGITLTDGSGNVATVTPC